ncbi:MAG: polysaccharide biosynthesis/export family protein [Epsilonproteobacteria bacterium]|nr:polysaccharide biosynthesis/export family protein [Campylobacterota bacterium]
MVFIFLVLTGCSLKDDYVLFNQSPAMQVGSQVENLNKTATTRVDAARFEYKIRPHDRLSIVTYKHPQLSTTTANANANGGLGQSILVNSQGEIRLPLIETVKIGGLSQPQAQLRLENQFKEYLRRPSIQLEVLNKRAYVLGEVNNPGPIELQNEQLPLLQLLSIAGDLTTAANRQSIMILKNHDDAVVTKVVSLTDANSIRVANQMIQPNDIVYVVPRGISLFNTRVGEVNPVFQLVANALTPFLTIRLLTR